MTSKNEITGDKLISKQSNKAFDEGYDRIFRKDSVEKVPDDSCKSCEGGYREQIEIKED